MTKQECLIPEMLPDTIPGIHKCERQQPPNTSVRIGLSKFNRLDESDIVGLLGKLQQHGIVRITYNQALDEEAHVELTLKGQQFICAFLQCPKCHYETSQHYFGKRKLEV